MTIVVCGTSIEAFTGPTSWRERLDARLGGGRIKAYSLGGGAYTRANANGETIRTYVDRAIAEQPPGLMYLAGPVNDLMITYLEAMSDVEWAVHHADVAATAAGWTVLGGAILPFTDGGAFAAGYWPALEQRRQHYNSWAAAHFGSRWVNLGARLAETATARGDNRWFSDGLHPNRFGAAVIAEEFPMERLAGF